MGKKIKETKEKDQQPVKAKEVEKAEQEPIDVEESLTVKQKKENAKKMLKAVKKMNAKAKKSIEKKQIVKAVGALKKFAEHQKSQNLQKKLLEDEDDFVQLTFTLTQVPTNPTPRPLQIKLPHPFNSKANNTRVCVFVKDPARSFKDQIKDLKVSCIAKVMGYTKLKKEFKQYKDKKSLLKEYDMFLADLRIYKMLPECLGKEFYSKKKYPCPIKLHGFKTPKELQKQLNRASKATYFIQGNGPNYTLKVGKTSQDPKEIAENIEAALPFALAYVGAHDDIKFSKIQSISVKVGESPELPVFNQLQKSEILAFLADE